MTTIPTRWLTAFNDQLADADLRLNRAQQYLDEGDGGRALQEAYPAVVAAASIRVWLSNPPWEQSLGADELQRRVREGLPSRFAALAEVDVQQALTSPWTATDAEPYVRETHEYVTETKQRLEAWLEQE